MNTKVQPIPMGINTDDEVYCIPKFRYDEMIGKLWQVLRGGVVWRLHRAYFFDYHVEALNVVSRLRSNLAISTASLILNVNSMSFS